MLPPSALPHARRAGSSRSHGPGGSLRGARPAWSVQRRGAAGGLGGPPPHLPGARLGAQEIERLPRRRSAAARDSLSLSLSQPVPRAGETPPQPRSSFSRESTATAGFALQAAPRSRPKERMQGGGGAGKGEASPLHRACYVSHTPTRLRPYCRADSQWKHASAADDAEIRHGGAARCPGGGVQRWLHSALCCHAALRWAYRERRSWVLVPGANSEVGFTPPGPRGSSPLERPPGAVHFGGGEIIK